MVEKTGVHAKAQESKQKCSNSCKQKSGYNSSGSPADGVLQLQKTAGNQAVQRLIKSRALQAKLRIGQPGDIYEQEADRVAEQVMRMPGPVLQRKCAMCNEDEKKVLQAKESTGQLPVAQGQDAPLIVQEVLRSPGQPLDETTRYFMEPRFGQDFSRVRVHTDDRAKESAQLVNALAYTVGNNIVFGEGQYRSNSEEGRKLVAHELSHVVQQRSGTELARANMSISLSADSLKTQADDIVDRTASKPSLNYPLNGIHTDKLSNTLQRQSEGCPPEGVTTEEKHAGLCSEIKREPGELEKYSTPQIKELTSKKCYLLWGFGSDSAKFGDLPKLNEIVELFSKNSDSTMNIDGYTDCIRIDKNPTANEELRWRRADRVANYFINVKGLDRKRIFTGAPPNNQYVRPNNAAEDRAMNRSVTINLTAGKKPIPPSPVLPDPDKPPVPIPDMPVPPECDRNELARRVNKCIEEAKRSTLNCHFRLLEPGWGGVKQGILYLYCLRQMREALRECDRRAKKDTNCPD